jgi:hypothetical protein
MIGVVIPDSKQIGVVIPDSRFKGLINALLSGSTTFNF